MDPNKSSGYKYQRRDNGDVFIIDMSNREHGLVASLLQRYFNFPNNNVVVDPPIVVGIDECNPSGNGQLIASDVTIFPNANHVQQPHIPYPGSPPRDRNFGTLIRKKQTPTNCNAPNLPQYQVIIPIAQVFWDPVLPLPPADGYVPTVPISLATGTAPVNFIIDLYQVQQLVLNEQDNT
ncbi:19941_t:CDS:2 [Racocetra fulgida]|uniref:19941_t:CDS:1 n=1 Tax=Racocetra fulgida TaxID=60492 RepID=A0A9N8ZK35_9GLOM|nr:19941_t:CDS:2 [Racocetra fulgida]